jgi:uncharacterized protein DUF4430
VTRRALIVLAAALALAGCGFGPGEAKQGPVELRVTRDFGQKELSPPAQRDQVHSSDTVMRLLQASHKVTTAYGGGFVQSIDGLAGNKSGEHDWFFYVNGTESSQGAADDKLSLSDVVQWDYHRWSATMHIPAIVGAFPEPFLHGQSGSRLPTRVECADANSTACNDVTSALDAEHVVTTQAVLGSSTGEKSLRVVVGPWSTVGETVTGRTMQQGPASAGVFAHFTPGGALTLLDGFGHVARTAPPGSGLVAAMVQEGGGVVWVVTGQGEAATERAARLLDRETLRNAFAVAATPSGPVKLPVGGF